MLLWQHPASPDSCLVPAAYNVVGFAGTGSVSYNEALAAIFIEGWIFIALSLVRASPPSCCTTPCNRSRMYTTQLASHLAVLSERVTGSSC